MAPRDETMALIAAADALRDAVVCVQLDSDDRRRMVKLVNEYGRARMDVVGILEESDLSMIRDRDE